MDVGMTTNCNGSERIRQHACTETVTLGTHETMAIRTIPMSGVISITWRLVVNCQSHVENKI
jgi:hypothetical protein